MSRATEMFLMSSDGGARNNARSLRVPPAVEGGVDGTVGRRGGTLPLMLRRIVIGTVALVAAVLLVSVSGGILFVGSGAGAGRADTHKNLGFAKDEKEKEAEGRLQQHQQRGQDHRDESKFVRSSEHQTEIIEGPPPTTTKKGADEEVLVSTASSHVLNYVRPLQPPPQSPLHPKKGAFIDDPSLPTRCSETSAALGDKKRLPFCPSLGYTDKVFAAVRRVADADITTESGSASSSIVSGAGAGVVVSDVGEPLRMSLDPHLSSVPHLRYAVTNGRTTSHMSLFYTADDDSLRQTSQIAAGGGTMVTFPYRGAVHPAFEVYAARSMRGQLTGVLSGTSSASSSSSSSSSPSALYSFNAMARVITEQKSAEEMQDHKNAKAGVEDSVWVGGYAPGDNAPQLYLKKKETQPVARTIKKKSASTSINNLKKATDAVAVPSISYKQLSNTRVFEFNGVHTLYDFDCVPDIDFRQYHQVRAASCIDHERLFARSVDFGARKADLNKAVVTAENYLVAGSSLARFKSAHTQTEEGEGDNSGSNSVDGKDEEGLQLGAFLASSTPSLSSTTTALASLIPNYAGLFPIVDEEYFEYSFTLAVAHDAAVHGRPFTFVELGARYGTWLVRAAAAYRLFYRGPSGHIASTSMTSNSGLILSEGEETKNRASELSIPLDYLRLMAVEGNCHWFRKMEEHVRCNGFEPYSTLLLSYAAPPSYNKVIPADPSTHKQPRAVSVVQMVMHYVELAKATREERLKMRQGEGKEDKSSFYDNKEDPDHHPAIDMIDFDIQGFETISLEHEEGAVDALTEHVGFIHFGTHGTEIETTLLRLLQPKGWCVVYFYAGAHTKNLARGHRCQTPYGSSVFNDGAMGLANLKFYYSAFGGDRAKGIRGTCPETLQTRSNKRTAKQCYFAPQALTMIKRD